MQKFIKTLVRVINKYYLLIIFIILLVSYGQILFMLPWQDDNAMFFKLAHIYEPAGFLGNGIFGEGAYKYTAFFYYPIYLIFGYNPFFYFLFCFGMYALSTYIVYKTTTRIFDKNSGMLAGFLYACGFIGSDSYIRLFNSIITSLSVILVSLFLNFYWNYIKVKKIKWYFFATIIFFAAAEFARARTHYLIALPFLIEFVYLTFRKPILKSLSFSVIRLIPFITIFYRYVIVEDFRSKEAGSFIISLISGEFYKVFGFLSSFSNLILPNWLITLLSPNSVDQSVKNYLSNSMFYFTGIVLFAIVCLIYLFVKYKKTRAYILAFVTFSILWKYISSVIFLTPFLTASPDQILLAFIGGELLFLGALIFFMLDKKYKPIYFILFSGIVINLLSYSAYNPTQVYEKINRYLSHSFYYLTLFGSFVYFISTKKARSGVLLILLLWGTNNLVEGFFYQKSILANRTQPVRLFYSEFQKMVPDVKKGDVIYFDVADNVRGRFADAFSVAQMPNTTAIAWRYGIDRDDFYMFEDPEELFNFLKSGDNKTRRIRTFFYSKDGLIDTTGKFLEFYDSSKTIGLNIGPKTSELVLNEQPSGTYISKSEVEISDNLKIPSLVPLKLRVSLIAKPHNFTSLTFPIHYGLDSTTSTSDSNLAFEYKRFRDKFRDNSVEVSSTWQNRVGKNLIDNDPNSSWQADRLRWLKAEQNLIIKMQNEDYFNRLSFVNSFSDNSPLEFEMFYSTNLVDWKSLGLYKNDKRLANGELVTVDFESQKFKYFKIKFNKTLNGDSPAISEVLLIPTRFSLLEIKETNEYLKNPFATITDLKTYNNLLRNTLLNGNVDLYWMNNKNFGWQTNTSSNAKVTFDGREHQYEISISAGGTEITKLKFVSTNFPGELTVTRIQVLHALP